MAIKSNKCPTCGAPLIKIDENRYQCEYCGLLYEEKKDDDSHDKWSHILNDAFLKKEMGKFDEAILEYERILSENPEYYLAYWGALLAEYGILFSKSGEEKGANFYKFNITPMIDCSYYRNLMNYCSNDDERNAFYKKTSELECIRLEIIKKIKNDNTEFLISTIEPQQNNNLLTEQKISNQLYNEIVSRGKSVFWSVKDLKNIAYKDYEPYLFSALYHAKKLIVIVNDKKDANCDYVKSCWKRFKKLGDIEGKEIIFLPLKNNPNDFDYELRNSNVIEYKISVVNDIIKYLFQKPQLIQEEDLFQNKNEEIIVKNDVKPNTKELKNNESSVVEKTSNVDYGQESERKFATNANAFADKGTYFDKIQTNSEALRSISDDLKKYKNSQISLLNQCLTDLNYISYEWNDNNFEKLVQEVSNITNNFERNLSEFDSFSEWLNRKAEIIERQKNIK